MDRNDLFEVVVAYDFDFVVEILEFGGGEADDQLDGEARGDGTFDVVGAAETRRLGLEDTDATRSLGHVFDLNNNFVGVLGLYLIEENFGG